MLGLNNLDNGCSEYQLADTVIHVANSMILHLYHTEAVVITSLWPRSSQEYNRRARLYLALREETISYYSSSFLAVGLPTAVEKYRWHSFHPTRLQCLDALTGCTHCVGNQSHSVVIICLLNAVVTEIEMAYKSSLNTHSMPYWIFCVV